MTDESDRGPGGADDSAAAPAEPTQAGSFAHRATHGALIYLGRTAIVQVIQIVSSLLVAHLVIPRQYGVFTLATTAIGVAAYSSDVGVSSALLLHKDLDEDHIRSGAGAALAAGFASTLLLILCAPLIVSAFNAPSTVAPLIWLISPSVMLQRLGFEPMLRLTRSLRFSRLGLVSLLQTLSLYVLQIILLLEGFGIWGMGIALVAQSFVGLVLLLKFGGGMSMPRFNRLTVAAGAAGDSVSGSVLSHGRARFSHAGIGADAARHPGPRLLGLVDGAGDPA